MSKASLNNDVLIHSPLSFVVQVPHGVFLVSYVEVPHRKFHASQFSDTGNILQLIAYIPFRYCPIGSLHNLSYFSSKQPISGPDALTKLIPFLASIGPTENLFHQIMKVQSSLRDQSSWVRSSSVPNFRTH